MLEITALEAGYGSIPVLHGVDLCVREGEIVSLVGANGAGKSTLLNTISGVLRPRAGALRFLGDRIDGLGTDEVVRRGISQCPEGRRVFPRMTVTENLLLGAYTRQGERKWQAKGLEMVFHHFPVLNERRKQMAGTLSGGEQQILAIARALMARPRLLLLDEPSLGLAPIVVHQVFEIIGEISRQGITILLVEQNAHMAISCSSSSYLLESGTVLLSGNGTDLLGDARVKAAYLGG